MLQLSSNRLPCFSKKKRRNPRPRGFIRFVKSLPRSCSNQVEYYFSLLFLSCWLTATPLDRKVKVVLISEKKNNKKKTQELILYLWCSLSCFHFGYEKLMLKPTFELSKFTIFLAILFSKLFFFIDSSRGKVLTVMTKATKEEKKKENVKDFRTTG